MGNLIPYLFEVSARRRTRPVWQPSKLSPLRVGRCSSKVGQQPVSLTSSSCLIREIHSESLGECQTRGLIDEDKNRYKLVVVEGKKISKSEMDFQLFD